MNEKIIQLINKLIQNTEGGKIEWVKTSRDTEFKADFINGAISSDLWDESGTLKCDFRVYNSRGDQVAFWVYKSNEEEYKLLAKLNSTIFRKYLKIDETLEGILEELN